MAISIQSSGFHRMFVPDRLTVGVSFPREAAAGTLLTLADQIALAQRAEALGFAALWVRDIPLYEPSIGEGDLSAEPLVYLGYVAAHTQTIALATENLILPLRHPLHLARAAASVDQLSGGRLVMGVTAGDRPIDFLAFKVDFEQRDQRFRHSFHDLQHVLSRSFPVVRSPLMYLDGADVLPKPVGDHIPLLVAGHSRQSLVWIAEHADGWLYSPWHPQRQVQLLQDWRRLVNQLTPGGFKPFAPTLSIDLSADPTTAATPIPLGYHLGRDRLLELLHHLWQLGVSHISLNLHRGQRPTAEVLEEIGQLVLPALAASTV